MPEQELQQKKGQVYVWPSVEGCWIASFLFEENTYFFIGGPGIDDGKLYGSRWEAFAAIARCLASAHAKKRIRVASSTRVRLQVVSDCDLPNGGYVLELRVRDGDPPMMFFAVGPSGPFERVLRSARRASRVARRLTVTVEVASPNASTAQSQGGIASR